MQLSVQVNSTSNFFSPDMMGALVCLTLLQMGVSLDAIIIIPEMIKLRFVSRSGHSLIALSLSLSLWQSWGVQGRTGTSLQSSATNLSKTKRHGTTPGPPAGVWVPSSYPSARLKSSSGWKATCTWVWNNMWWAWKWAFNDSPAKHFGIPI